MSMELKPISLKPMTVKPLKVNNLNTNNLILNNLTTSPLTINPLQSKPLEVKPITLNNLSLNNVVNTQNTILDTPATQEKVAGLSKSKGYTSLADVAYAYYSALYDIAKKDLKARDFSDFTNPKYLFSTLNKAKNNNIFKSTVDNYKPFWEAEWYENLSNFNETVDLVANPVKGLIADVFSGNIKNVYNVLRKTSNPLKAFEQSNLYHATWDPNRVQYDWNIDWNGDKENKWYVSVPNWLTNFVLEFISDPANLLEFGAGDAAQGLAKSASSSIDDITLGSGVQLSKVLSKKQINKISKEYVSLAKRGVAPQEISNRIFNMINNDIKYSIKNDKELSDLYTAIAKKAGVPKKDLSQFITTAVSKDANDIKNALLKAIKESKVDSWIALSRAGDFFGKGQLLTGAIEAPALAGLLSIMPMKDIYHKWINKAANSNTGLYKAINSIYENQRVYLPDEVVRKGFSTYLGTGKAMENLVEFPDGSLMTLAEKENVGMLQKILRGILNNKKRNTVIRSTLNGKLYNYLDNDYISNMYKAFNDNGEDLLTNLKSSEKKAVYFVYDPKHHKYKLKGFSVLTQADLDKALANDAIVLTRGNYNTLSKFMNGNIANKGVLSFIKGNIISPFKGSVLLRVGAALRDLFDIVPKNIIDLGPDDLKFTASDSIRLSSHYNKILDKFLKEIKDPDLYKAIIADDRTIDINSFINAAKAKGSLSKYINDIETFINKKGYTDITNWDDFTHYVDMLSTGAGATVDIDQDVWAKYLLLKKVDKQLLSSLNDMDAEFKTVTGNTYNYKNIWDYIAKMTEADKELATNKAIIDYTDNTVIRAIDLGSKMLFREGEVFSKSRSDMEILKVFGITPTVPKNFKDPETFIPKGLLLPDEITEKLNVEPNTKVPDLLKINKYNKQMQDIADKMSKVDPDSADYTVYKTQLAELAMQRQKDIAKSRPQLKRNDLESLADYYNISWGKGKHHNAGTDAEVTAKIHIYQVLDSLADDRDMPDKAKIFNQLQKGTCKDPKILNAFKGTTVVLDIETSGTALAEDHVLQIGAYKIVDGKITDKFYKYIIPTTSDMKTVKGAKAEALNKWLTPEISELTGIKTSAYRENTSFYEDEGLKIFRDWIGDSKVVGQNSAAFDIPFLNNWFSKYNLENIEGVSDTMWMQRRLHPNIYSTSDTIKTHNPLSVKNNPSIKTDAAGYKYATQAQTRMEAETVRNINEANKQLSQTKKKDLQWSLNNSSYADYVVEQAAKYGNNTGMTGESLFYQYLYDNWYEENKHLQELLSLGYTEESPIYRNQKRKVAYLRSQLSSNIDKYNAKKQLNTNDIDTFMNQNTEDYFKENFNLIKDIISDTDRITRESDNAYQVYNEVDNSVNGPFQDDTFGYDDLIDDLEKDTTLLPNEREYNALEQANRAAGSISRSFVSDDYLDMESVDSIMKYLDDNNITLEKLYEDILNGQRSFEEVPGLHQLTTSLMRADNNATISPKMGTVLEDETDSAIDLLFKIRDIIDDSRNDLAKYQNISDNINGLVANLNKYDSLLEKNKDRRSPILGRLYHNKYKDAKRALLNYYNNIPNKTKTEILYNTPVGEFIRTTQIINRKLKRNIIMQALADKANTSTFSWQVIKNIDGKDVTTQDIINEALKTNMLTNIDIDDYTKRLMSLFPKDSAEYKTVISYMENVKTIINRIEDNKLDIRQLMNGLDVDWDKTFNDLQESVLEKNNIGVTALQRSEKLEKYLSDITKQLRFKSVWNEDFVLLNKQLDSFVNGTYRPFTQEDLDISNPYLDVKPEVTTDDEKYIEALKWQVKNGKRKTSTLLINDPEYSKKLILEELNNYIETGNKNFSPATARFYNHIVNYTAAFNKYKDMLWYTEEPLGEGGVRKVFNYDKYKLAERLFTDGTQESKDNFFRACIQSSFYDKNPALGKVFRTMDDALNFKRSSGAKTISANIDDNVNFVIRKLEEEHKIYESQNVFQNLNPENFFSTAQDYGEDIFEDHFDNISPQTLTGFNDLFEKEIKNGFIDINDVLLTVNNKSKAGNVVEFLVKQRPDVFALPGEIANATLRNVINELRYQYWIGDHSVSIPIDKLTFKNYNGVLYPSELIEQAQKTLTAKNFKLSDLDNKELYYHVNTKRNTTKAVYNNKVYTKQTELNIPTSIDIYAFNGTDYIKKATLPYDENIIGTTIEDKFFPIHFDPVEQRLKWFKPTAEETNPRIGTFLENAHYKFSKEDRTLFRQMVLNDVANNPELLQAYTGKGTKGLQRRLGYSADNILNLMEQLANNPKEKKKYLKLIKEEFLTQASDNAVDLDIFFSQDYNNLKYTDDFWDMYDMFPEHIKQNLEKQYKKLSKNKKGPHANTYFEKYVHDFYNEFFKGHPERIGLTSGEEADKYVAELNDLIQYNSIKSRLNRYYDDFSKAFLNKENVDLYAQTLYNPMSVVIVKAKDTDSGTWNYNISKAVLSGDTKAQITYVPVTEEQSRLIRYAEEHFLSKEEWPKPDIKGELKYQDLVSRRIQLVKEGKIPDNVETRTIKSLSNLSETTYGATDDIIYNVVEDNRKSNLYKILLKNKLAEFLDKPTTTDLFHTPVSIGVVERNVTNDPVYTKVNEMINRTKNSIKLHKALDDYSYNPYTNAMNKVTSVGLKPFSDLEQWGRIHLMENLTRSKGYTINEAIDEAIRTHFDYSFKTPLMQYAELVFPFLMFPIENTKWWSKAIWNNPQLARMYFKTLEQNWNLKNRTEYELENNHALENNVMTGNINLSQLLGLSKEGERDLVLKSGASLLDALGLFNDPAGAIEQRLNPLIPKKVLPWNWFNEEKSWGDSTKDMLNIVPFYGAIKQATSGVNYNLQTQMQDL